MVDIYRQDDKYCQRFRIPCYETDGEFRLKASSFMDMAQEIAYWAARMLGFGYDDLQTHHTAWVLSRMHFHYTEAPKWRDEVVLKTWHKGADGAFYLRDFRLESPEGRRYVECTSSWLVIDMDSRHIVRDPAVAGLVPAEGMAVEHAIEEPCPKLSVPAGIELEQAASHRVGYSDIDFLGHTNNACYMVWAMDCIDYDTAASKCVKDVYINFNRETRAGDTVQLRRAADGGTYYIDGLVNGKSAFCIRIEL